MKKALLCWLVLFGSIGPAFSQAQAAASFDWNDYARKPRQVVIYSIAWTVMTHAGIDAVGIRTNSDKKKIVEDAAEIGSLLRELRAIPCSQSRVPQDLRVLVDFLYPDGRVQTFSADRFGFYNVEKGRSIKMTPALMARLSQIAGIEPLK